MEHPLIAVLTSDAADSTVTSRGFSSIAQLLGPFTTHNVSIRDPTTAQSQQCSIKLDVRDIRKQGHLLSLSVLPHVLHEVLVADSDLEKSLNRFEDALRRWVEPNEQETLRTYIACIFVISANDEQPLAELSRLIQAQHTLQHSSESKPISPAHCSVPKWTTPNTLKHYVLLHDVARSDEARSNEIFNQLCTTYGVDSCQLLRIGNGPAEGLEDVWAEDVFNERLLAMGLKRALRHASSTNMEAVVPTSVATISPSYAMVPQRQQSIPDIKYRADSPSNRRLASTEDRENCSEIMEKFLRHCLIPHAERLMRMMNEQLGDRRGLGKSLTTGMKKWFGGSSTQSLGVNSYSAESSEMKSRRLADLAFQFGLLSLAYSQYRAVKKEFELGQGNLYQAAAVEMAAVALHLSNPALTSKQFPVHYLEDAVSLQLNSGGRITSIVRCALNCARIRGDLGQNYEAAALLSRVSLAENDVFVGVVQAIAAQYFEKAEKVRKAAFYRVLAANRFSKAEMPSVAGECNRLALSQYWNKGWESSEDHLCSLLSGYTNDKKLCIECASHLLRPTKLQTEEEQQCYVDTLIRTLSTYGDATATLRLVVPLPILNQSSVRVICGERPLLEDALTRESYDWTSIQRSAFHALFGNTTGFRPASAQLVCDDSTDNREIRETPIDERFRVCVALKNPLKIAIFLRNVFLEYEVTSSHEHHGVHCVNHHISEIEFGPDEEKEIELSLTPQNRIQFRIVGIHFDLLDSSSSSVSCRIPLEIKGKRLNNNLKQMKSRTYAVDNRLAAKVAHSRWPLLDFRMHKHPPSVVFCSQAIRLQLEVQNIGHEEISGLCLSTDAVDNVCLEARDSAGIRISSRSECGANTSEVRVHIVEATIPVGGNISLSIDLRAPQNEGEFSSSLLFFYRGAGGAFREWRYVLATRAVRLLELKSTVLDADHGLISINIRNHLSSEEAALARVDMLRVRMMKQEIDKRGDWISVPTVASIAPVKLGQVQLDSEQSRTICLNVLDQNGPSHFWLCGEMNYPDWQAPRPSDPETDVESLIAVFWRASLVDNTGHVSSLLGELFLPCSLPISQHMDMDCGEYTANSFSVQADPVVPVKHDFASQRLCSFPFTISIANRHCAGEPVDIVVSFLPKVSTPVHSQQQLSPEHRQLWWPNRIRAKHTLLPGTKHNFTFMIRVAQPVIYELGGSQLRIEAITSTGQPIVLQSPSTLAVISAF